MRLLESLDADMSADESDQVRYAADALLFQRFALDHESHCALRAAQSVVRNRLAAGSARIAMGRLLLELDACGPHSLRTSAA